MLFKKKKSTAKHLKMSDLQSQAVSWPTSNEMLNPEEQGKIVRGISLLYPFILYVNVTKDTYRILKEGKPKVAPGIPKEGKFTDYLQYVSSMYYGNDGEGFLEAYCQSNLLVKYEQGYKKVSFLGRRVNEEGIFHWIRSIAIFLEGEPNQDLEVIAFIRVADEEAQVQFEQERRKKILELTTMASFEYICIIDTVTGLFEMFSNTGEDTHNVRKIIYYDDAVAYIRDTFILPEEREQYFETARLSSIIDSLDAGGGHFKHCYHFEENGKTVLREANFRYYDDEQMTIFMTNRTV